MFFFFVGGVEQQVRQVLKYGAGRCIACRSPADLVEYDKVLKLFFVPVWRWPGKEPVMFCKNCNLFFPRSYSLPPPPTADSVVPDVLRCRFCDRAVEPDFSFCPFCGTALWALFYLFLGSLRIVSNGWGVKAKTWGFWVFAWGCNFVKWDCKNYDLC